MVVKLIHLKSWQNYSSTKTRWQFGNGTQICTSSIRISKEMNLTELLQASKSSAKELKDSSACLSLRTLTTCTASRQNRLKPWHRTQITTSCLRTKRRLLPQISMSFMVTLIICTAAMRPKSAARFCTVSHPLQISRMQEHQQLSQWSHEKTDKHKTSVLYRSAQCVTRRWNQIVCSSMKPTQRPIIVKTRSLSLLTSVTVWSSLGHPCKQTCRSR